MKNRFFTPLFLITFLFSSLILFCSAICSCCKIIGCVNTLINAIAPVQTTAKVASKKALRLIMGSIMCVFSRKPWVCYNNRLMAHTYWQAILQKQRHPDNHRHCGSPQLIKHIINHRLCVPSPWYLP